MGPKFSAARGANFVKLNKYWLQEVRTHLDRLLLNYGDHTENLPSSFWLEFGRRLDSQPVMLVDHGQNYRSL